MKRIKIHTPFFILLLISFLTFNSCKDFFTPDQEINITEDELYTEWYEYRSIAMGLYGLQQQLAEQLLILGELRGDLLTITENADADLVEIYNFNPSPDNKYASPVNFYKLISATNKFINILQHERPEVMDSNSPITNYDRLYGEALCMRAWAYFNAVRIYGKIPFINESLTSIEETEEFLNSSGTYIDSVDIIYSKDGYSNDTIYNNSIELDRQYFDQSIVIDYFTNELEQKIKAVGVNHYQDNNDISWEVTIWNIHAMNALLGSMYLTAGDLAKAAHYFEKIIYFPSSNRRYQLDATFSHMNWRNIFTNIDSREHIFTLWFNKSYFQQNDFQMLFEPRNPHQYMLKPTRQAVLNWETIWYKYTMYIHPGEPWLTRTNLKGIPGDSVRGYGLSYNYLRDGVPLDKEDIKRMLNLKSENDVRSANLITEGVDTVVWKYSWSKDVYDMDANFIVYRASGIHLWLAEIYTYWQFNRSGGVSTFTTNALNLLNSGANYSPNVNRPQLGIRGRVGYRTPFDIIKLANTIYVHDPFTNQVIGYLDFSGNFIGMQEYLEEQMLDEKAREMAYEGERFYDLIRIAKRRNDPSFLAERVSQKYPADKREEIYNLLLNEENWYINIFE